MGISPKLVLAAPKNDPKRVDPERDDRGSAICRVGGGKLYYSVDKEYWLDQRVAVR